MKAVVLRRHGPPDVLEPAELPPPDVGPDDVLVRVHATSVNPVDAKIRHASAVPHAFPLTLGFDVSGVVERLGARAEGSFKPGDEVFGSPNLFRAGADAELVAVDYRTLARKPRTLTHEQAAALPLVSITAWEALHRRARIRPGETVLIHGGAGGVGHVALQLARLHGCEVLTTAGRDESVDFCRTFCGADEVIDYRKADFVARVLERTGRRGLRAVIDLVGGETFARSIDCVAVNGDLVTILGSETAGRATPLLYKNVTVHYEFMGIPAAHGIEPERHGELLAGIARLADRGLLKPHVGRIVPLEALAEAHRAIETGHTLGKIVVRVR